MDKYFPLQVAKSDTDYRNILLSKAFTVVQGESYNRVSYELREQNKGRSLVFYEIILKEDRPWQSLKDEVYPPLIRFMRYKSLDPKTGLGLIVALFFKDQFYLIEGSEFIKVYCQMEGINQSEFEKQAVKWLSEGSL